MRVCILLGLACSLGLAQSWTGYLVDSRCYSSLERNRNPRDTLTEVDRDRDSEVRYCRPAPRTRTFAIVDFNGQSFELDAAGNSKAAALAAAAGFKRFLHVTVTGALSGNTVKVQSIAPAK